MDELLPITVLIADDHTVLRRGLHSLLDTTPDIQVIGEAESGPEAVQQARDLQPAVILMDINMPGYDGMEASRRILAAQPATRIVCLTQYEDEARLFAALELGIQGYLLKNADPDTVFQAIRLVAEGKAFIDPDMMPHLLAEFQRRQQVGAPGLAVARSPGAPPPPSVAAAPPVVSVPVDAQAERQYTSMGTWIKTQRRAAGWTQEELAARLGYSLTMIRKLEAGTARPSHQLAEALAQTFGVPAAEQAGFIEWARRPDSR